MYGWHDQGMGGGWWVLMMFGMLLFWAVFVVGAVVLLRHYRSDAGTPKAVSSSAIDVLKERFARGEITEAEYRSSLALLKEQH